MAIAEMQTYGIKRRPFQNPKTEICKICGKPFLKTSSMKQTCSKECSYANMKLKQRERYEADPEGQKRMARERSRIRRMAKPTVRCRICGQLIYRGINTDRVHTKPQMHEECVINDCLDTLRKGEKLTSKQYHRLQYRGFGLKEFKKEYWECLN